MQLKAILISLFICFSTLWADRYKRYLIFPPTAPTRHQWIVGIGIPLDLEHISVVTGYVLKAQYFLPTTPENLHPSYSWPNLSGRRARREVKDVSGEVLTDETGLNYTRYTVPIVVVEEKANEEIRDDIDPEFFEEDDQIDEQKENLLAQNVWSAMRDEGPKLDNSRWSAYRMIAGIAERNGWEGRGCVLRMICEAAESPISHKSGILGELIHIILTPSTSNDANENPIDDEYRKAEQVGATVGDCNKEFDCEKSLLDGFTDFQDPFNSLFALMS